MYTGIGVDGVLRQFVLGELFGETFGRPSRTDCAARCVHGRKRVLPRTGALKMQGDLKTLEPRRSYQLT